MARAKEKSARTALDTLQDWLSGGGQALLEGAHAVQQLMVATGRGVEEQLAALLSALEENLRDQVDRLVSGLAASLRNEVENVRDEVEELREHLQDSSAATGPIDQVLGPSRASANGAVERAAYAQSRLTELAQRLERVEGLEDPNVRIAELERRLASERATASSDPLDPYLGKRLTSIPEHAASVWGVYKFAFQGSGVPAGGGGVGERRLREGRRAGGRGERRRNAGAPPRPHRPCRHRRAVADD